MTGISSTSAIEGCLFLLLMMSTRASSNVDFPAYSDGGDVEHIDDIAPSASAADPDGGANVMMMTGGDRFEEDNYCRRNNSFVWCLPKDYNQEKHPFTFSHLINKSLPWNYDFKFVVEEISHVNDKDQTMSISMYFGVSWIDPRLQINASAPEWTEARTGPKDEVNVSPESLKYMWYPELEIYGLERFGRQRVLKEMSGVRIKKDKTIHYELGVRITISCRMLFDDYPLDAHTCQFQVGSYYDTEKTVLCTSEYVYDSMRQRSLQHYIKFEKLPEKDRTVVLPSGRYAACGFQIQLVRKQVQYLVQVYLPSGMFVITSWVSFLIKPEIVPGRMALLVTLFLVLINIFNSVRQRAPISSSLNALDLYIVVCIFLIFGALMEYAAILFLLSKRRKPRYTIGGGLQTMFSNNGDMNSAAAAAAAAASGPSNAQIAADASNEDLELQTPIIRRSKKSTSSQPQIQTGTQPGTTSSSNGAAGDTGHSEPHLHAICENIDAWAVWISPPMFLVFNLVYWFAYQHVEFDPPEPAFPYSSSNNMTLSG